MSVVAISQKSEIKNLADADTTLPTSWTTIFTSGKQSKVVCTELNFHYKTGTSTITIEVRLIKNDGSTTRPWGQAKLDTAGEQVHFLDCGDTIILEANSGIQIQETTGAAVAYVLQGYETLGSGV